MRPEEEARLRELLADLHEGFKTTVREARGAKLASSNEEELWSGRAWTGRQAAKLGLVDGVGTLEGVMRAKFGDKVSPILALVVRAAAEPQALAACGGR